MASRNGSELEALYAAAPESFTEERKAAIARARAAGDAGAVARLKAAKKPVVTAWAVNQLVRRHPDAIDALLEAGDRVRAAHARIVAGGRSPELREASTAVRDAREALVPLASRILEEGTGHAPTADQLMRLRRTLESAAHGSEGFREHFREGRLVQDLSPPAVFDAGGPAITPTAAPSPRPTAKQPTPTPKSNPTPQKAARKDEPPPPDRQAQVAERRRIRAEAIEARKRERAEAAERRQREGEARRVRAEADRERARARLEADRRIAALEKDLAQAEAEARRLHAELERARVTRRRLD